MEYKDDDLRDDINEIKSSIVLLKTIVLSIAQHLKISLPLQDIKLEHEFQDLLNQLSTPTAPSLDEKSSIQEEILAPKNFFLIDPKFAKTESVRKIVASYDKNLSSCKGRGEFLQFCYFAISLLEDFVKRFIRRKFQELVESENTDILDGYFLLERGYQKENRNMENVYVDKNTKLFRCRQFPDDEDRFYLVGDKYLSLISLEKSKMYFLTELCFATLYKEDFFLQNYRIRSSNSSRDPQTQSLPESFKRPIKKSKSDASRFQKKYYDRISNARNFRNIYEHNKDNKVQQQKEIESKSRYVREDLNNYDGILEAVMWLIHQL